MHIKGLFDKFLGYARLLTPAGTLYGKTDKLQQIHEPTGRILQRNMIHAVRQCKYLESTKRGTNGWRGEEQRTERDGRGEETGTQGKVWLPAVSLIDKVTSKVTCHGGSGQASHKADKEQ